ncbi:hypothetical protein KFZ76_04565 [Methylovulum psychrotolerans]|uniref:hypothetical protein n=1 Tax=Methylovulum psychrotolerans TaxID=1704499 RepID=UPI001BFFCC60|nr:hypothetical protein [Methylovulum psychrotolerans]MBT9096986.1 hypothetical protein [Methylovulum psychrotolerans]
MKNPKIILLFFLLHFYGVSIADIYKYTDSNGQSYFTNEPKRSPSNSSDKPKNTPHNSSVGSYSVEGGDYIFTIYNESIRHDRKKAIVLFYVRKAHKTINAIDDLFQDKYYCKENYYSSRADESHRFNGKRYAPPDSVVRSLGIYACWSIP